LTAFYVSTVSKTLYIKTKCHFNKYDFFRHKRAHGYSSMNGSRG